MDIDGGKTIQRFPADDLIKANGQAEAAELSRTRERLKESDEMMQEIRKINLKNIELQEKMTAQLAQIESFTNAARAASEEARTAAGMAREASEKVLEHSGKSSVNSEELSKTLASTLDEKIAGIKLPDVKEDILHLSTTIEDIIHKEDVKVYKNVQASVDKSLEEQTKKLVEELTEVIEDTVPGNKGITVVLILTFLVSLANLAIWILDYLGFLAY